MTHGSAAQKSNPDQRQLASATASATSEPELPDQVDEPEQQPLELILARNLISIVSLAAFLVNVEGHVVFYNDAAAAIIGSPFEETGPITREQWNARLEPSDLHGDPLPADNLPLAVASAYSSRLATPPLPPTTASIQMISATYGRMTRRHEGAPRRAVSSR